MACAASVGLGVASVAGVAGAQPTPDDPAADAPAGRLRVDLRCADYWAEPATGLTVTLDGSPLVPTGVNGRSVIHYGKYGPYATFERTDVGFDVAAGRHHLQLAAPDCASAARDVLVMPGRATGIRGRLAIADRQLRGTTAAPNGIGFAFGVGAAQLPAKSGVSTLGPEVTGYRSEAIAPQGVWVSTSWEHRHVALAWDLAFLWGTTSGTLTEIAEAAPVRVTPGAMPYTDRVLDMRSTLRVGLRAPLGSVVLTAGSGVGFELRAHDAQNGPGTDPFALAPTGAETGIYVPVWAALTVKPWCNGGFQLLASYDIHSSDGAENGLAIAAGMLWQPSGACAEPAGLVVR